MKNYHFKNAQSVPISAGPASTITSMLGVQGTGGNILDVNVKIDIEHTWTNDLEIRLKNPSGSSVILVIGQGGSGDNFEETIFDDDATASINGGAAPFQGVFRPQEALSLFNGANANGNWTLEVSDRAFQDGGSLRNWELEIKTDEAEVNTGPFLFNNRTSKTISPGGPNVVESSITVVGLENINIHSVGVTIDIQHSYTNDLKISLISPSGDSVTLVDKEGGSGDDFRDTTFEDDAAQPITSGSPPFTGTFRPEGKLSDFQGQSPNGTWILKIEDSANQDGGSLNSWALVIRSDATPPLPPRPFEIVVRFLGGLSPSQQDIFKQATDRWAEVITGNLIPVQTDIGLVDDIVIDAEGIHIDGERGILGQAGPTKVRSGSLLPARGIMQFDIADLQKMEDEGELMDVIIHEMGHVLGIGTLWSHLNLIRGAGTSNPEFTGINAMMEYAVLKNRPNPSFVPLANTGGDGTREGHWRESVFNTELMTGYDDPGRNALSRLTIASLQDLGYQVSYSSADAYILPFSLLSARAIEEKRAHICMMKVPEFEILPETT